MCHLGKRAETIRKSWQQTFNNAAWHEPAVILFDDLDQLISAPSLLQENGPEAHYSLRLAQGRITLVCIWFSIKKLCNLCNLFVMHHAKKLYSACFQLSHFLCAIKYTPTSRTVIGSIFTPIVRKLFGKII